MHARKANSNMRKYSRQNVSDWINPKYWQIVINKTESKKTGHFWCIIQKSRTRGNKNTKTANNRSDYRPISNENATNCHDWSQGGKGKSNVKRRFTRAETPPYRNVSTRKNQEVHSAHRRKNTANPTKPIHLHDATSNDQTSKQTTTTTTNSR